MVKTLTMQVDGRTFKVYLSIFANFGIDFNIYEVVKRKFLPGYKEIYFTGGVKLVESSDIPNIRERALEFINRQIAFDNESKKIREEFKKIS